jgi:hypothetical protein
MSDTTMHDAALAAPEVVKPNLDQKNSCKRNSGLYAPAGLGPRLRRLRYHH